MTTTVRALSCSVTFNAVSLTDVIQARGQIVADTGWPTCSVFVTAKPGSGEEDAALSVTAGAGNNVTRFTGVLREFRSVGFPKSIELVCSGTLAYAEDWAPHEDLVYVSGSGFLSADSNDMDPATDQVLVRAILDATPNVTYTSGDIAGTGITLGSEAPDAFTWKAGVSAWRMIQQLDRATLYRTYQDRNGAIKRVQMVGHPSGSPSFTLADDDVLDGSTGTRETTRTRNGVLVTGHDYGKGLGPVQATRTGSFHGWATRWDKFSSDMIESGEDPPGTPDGLGGLQAGDIADAVLDDVLKEFVEASVPTWRDDTIEPGVTMLLDCLNRLAIGENLWVQGYSWEVTDNWTATLTLSGGGI